MPLAISASAVERARALRTRDPDLAASRPIRILIADDHPIVREGLRALLATQPDFLVVGTASDGAEALRLARDLSPDVLLLDLFMPGLSGLDVMRGMRGAGICTRAVLLTASVDRSEIVRLLQSGLRGVVLKGSSMELIFKSIRKVHDGELWIDRETMAEVADALASSTDRVSASRDFGLTPREREVLQLVVEGETNKRVAERMRIGEDTVKHHLTAIFDKTGVSNRLELALFALHHRLVDTH